MKVHVIEGDHHEQISSCLSINRCVFGARRGGVWEGAKQSPMTFSAHTERLHVLEKERNSANAEAGLEARIELLQRMPIFGGIRSDILQFLLASCPVVFVSANAFFFREHDEADSMFVIQAGKVAVVKSWGEQEHVLSILKEGDCFGEMAVMEHGQRSASVRAVEDCTAICISAANLHRLYALDLKQFTLIQMNMGREVCRRLREAGNQLFRAKMGMPEADSSSASL